MINLAPVLALLKERGWNLPSFIGVIPKEYFVVHEGEAHVLFGCSWETDVVQRSGRIIASIYFMSDGGCKLTYPGCCFFESFGDRAMTKEIADAAERMRVYTDNLPDDPPRG